MTNNITVTLSLNGEIDFDKIAGEIQNRLRKEIERVGVKAEVSKPNELENGDFAIVLRSASGYLEEYVGKAVVVDEKDGNGDFYAYDIFSGKTIGVALRKEVRKATDEEVAEAKRQIAEEAERKKWAKIGREVNEFKVGDAVKYKSAFTTVTESIPGRLRIGVKNNIREDIVVQPTEISLIFPVEARFDRE